MKCPVCNQPLPDDSVFCQYCGTKLFSEEKQPIIAPTPEPVQASEPIGYGDVVLGFVRGADPSPSVSAPAEETASNQETQEPEKEQKETPSDAKKKRTWMLPCVSSVAVVLAICLIASFCYIGGQKTQIDELTASLAEAEAAKDKLRSENRTLGQKNSDLTTQNRDLRTKYRNLYNDIETYADHIGFIVDKYPNTYHRYDCFKLRNSSYEAHNVNYCEWLGYSPCPDCW